MTPAGDDPAGSGPSAWTVEVVENVAVARDTFRLRVAAPELARIIRPGQFAMVRPEGTTDPLLGRPFALYDVARDEAGAPWAVDLVYLVLGRGTAALARRRPGDALRAWGPLGNGFDAPPAGPVAFLAGGIGQTPFLALGRWWLGRSEYAGRSVAAPVPSAALFYGARSADLLAGLDDFAAAGIGVEVATDDGSAGRPGFAIDLLADRIRAGEPFSRLVGCGPPAMLRALARLADREGIACDLSLENHMACGFGVCFSCVAPIRQSDGSVDLKRVCVEGPVFEASRVVWDG